MSLSISEFRDTVLLDVVNPHGTYKVRAKPITIAGAAKTSRSKKTKKSKTPQLSPTGTGSPRKGYVVRILGGDEILRECFSDHSVAKLVKEYPNILKSALSKKSVRQLEALDLLQH